MANLTAMQESYIRGLRQLTVGSTKPSSTQIAMPSDRPGLGSRANQQQVGKEYAFYDRRTKLSQAMNISNKAMLASFIFYVLLVIVIYTVGGYSFMFFRVSSDDRDLDGDCKSKFHESHRENLEAVYNYPKGDATPYISRFMSDHTLFEDYPVDTDKVPPLVTGACSDQFFILQGFIKHVHEDLMPVYPDLKLIVYDLGLYKREKEILKQYCSCEVRGVDYSVYPEHVADTTNFAWRPIIIQDLLDEYGAVVYADVTTRFKSANGLKFVRARGQNDIIVWDTPSFTSLVAYTNKLTFKYLNESRCLYSDAGIIDSQLLAFYRTNVTWNSVMKPWLKCALNPECITPSWSRLTSCLHFRQPRTTGCHRYDISVLSIIINRGHQMTLTTNHKRYTPPRLTYYSEEEATLFLEQPWTNTQLLLLSLTPFLFLLLCVKRQLFRWLSESMLKK